jgi:hypothetical protein
VDVNGVITTLSISTGDSQSADMVSLYAQLDNLGLSMADVRFFIHSHPPSDNDIIAINLFADQAVAAGADRGDWLDNFQEVIVGPDNKSREFEFELGSDGETAISSSDIYEGGAVPAEGSSDRHNLQNSAANAQADAENKCGVTT